jgi:acyl carrier protein phosphodiesterase
MSERFFSSGVYEQIQLSQLGLPYIHREGANIGTWRQALEFLRHGFGLVRQQVRKSQAMTPDVLWEKVIAIHQNKLSAACPRPSLDQHIRQISADRAASNNG